MQDSENIRESAGFPMANWGGLSLEIGLLFSNTHVSRDVFIFITLENLQLRWEL